MSGGSGDAPPMPPADNGGQFLLSLLQRPSTNQSALSPLSLPSQSQLSTQSLLHTLLPQQQRQQQQQVPQQPQQPPVALDPAVAAVGPSLPLTPPLWQSNAPDLLSSPWPHNLSPSFPSSFQVSQNPVSGSQFRGNQQRLGDDFQRLGFSPVDVRGSNTAHNLLQQKQQLEQKLQFGSFSSDTYRLNPRAEREFVLGNRNYSDLDFNLSDLNQRGGGGSGKQHHRGNYSKETQMPPPGFSHRPRAGGDWDYASRKREVYQIANKEKRNRNEFVSRNAALSSEDEGQRSGERSLTRQLDRPGPPAGSNLHSLSASDVEESLLNLDAEINEIGDDDGRELDDLGEEMVGSLLLEGQSDGKKEKQIRREKEFRSDKRGQFILSQRMRMRKGLMECRRDIERLNVPFLAIYESLIPPEEEKVKQKQLLTLLEKLVNKEWPEARLYIYGSCANSFGVSKSDIDVCLAIEDPDINKSEVLLRLADILESDNLQNVQALTRARVPIVKLMDPVTGISCDICINNVLAVVNTKLLRDYAQIDVRLRQLAFIVKHWAKSRGVNETYQGTLSSYAYVLMCINFLQLRRPAILPCLQEMEATYSVTVDDIKCAFFDNIESLHGFGSRNKETIAQLVWGFFNYWAYRHDYANSVVSVRSGSIMSKQEKEWTRRIGNDRHLICIEDPFEITHDLGRVVDKHSIRVLREEFERAADIMQSDLNPCVKLFEPYVPS